MHLLTHRVSLWDGDEELADIQAVNTVIFAYHYTADVVQIQRPHDVSLVRLPVVFMMVF